MAIVWVFVGIVACLLALTVFGARLLSAGRTVAANEGAVARAHQDALYFLARHAGSHADADYRAYERAMGTADAAQGARLGFPFTFLASSERLGQLAGQRSALVGELKGIAAALRESAPGADAAPRIHAVRQSIAPLRDEIASILGEMQHTAHSLVTGAVLGIAAILLLAGITISRRFLRQNEQLQRSLAESEQQLRHLVEAAPLPLLIVRAADQRIMYANERALEQFALDVDTALASTLAQFHVSAESRAALGTALSRDGSVRDFEVQLMDALGRAFWLVLSAQPMRYAGDVCLLVAMADIDEGKRLQEDMRRKAMHDPLTGLPNRAMFMESLERAVHKARRRAVRFSVLFLDLDHFKEVNDTMGHHAGDVLLQVLAERIASAVRVSDLVARLAGDEFVVLIEEHGGPEEVMIVAQKVLRALAQPVTIDLREAAVSGSIGIASYPEDGADVATLVKNADTAMYQAKERGRNNFQFYSAELNELSRHRFEQEKRVRGAIERNELFLEYQPELDLATGKPVAVEALLRWRDPSAGVVLPAAFMPLAEETGTSAAIGSWVLDRALRDLRSWRDLGLDIKVAVNLSPRQLQQQDLADELARLLELHGVEAAHLQLEITEPTLMQDSEAAQRALRALRALGVELAIDNFGTGYSSLGLVRGLPIQVVKIDKSLVSYCPSQRECVAIVQAAVAMSRVLGIRVVAEGVETEEQREAMRALGCDAMQGYLLARPMDTAGIAAMTRAAAEHTFLA